MKNNETYYGSIKGCIAIFDRSFEVLKHTTHCTHTKKKLFPKLQTHTQKKTFSKIVESES